MKNKKNVINVISPEDRECFASLYGRPEFPRFLRFLKTQKSNIAVVEWFRIRSTDPEIEIRRKKAYYEGQFDFISFLMKTFEDSKRGNKEEE